MKVTWSVANNCFVVIAGNELIDIDGKRFFESIDEITSMLKTKGLTVKNRMVVKI